MLKKYARGFSIAGAVCFILMGLLSGLSIIQAPYMGIFEIILLISKVILTAGCIVTAIGLIKGKKNVLFIIGTALLSVTSLCNIIKDIIYSLSFPDYFYGDFIFTVCNYLSGLSVFLIFIIALFTYLSKLSDKNQIISKLWFIPAIIFFIYSVVRVITYIREGIFSIGFLYPTLYLDILYNVLAILAFWGLGIWITSDLYETYSPNTMNNNNEYIDNFANAHFNLAGHIILLFLFGIWQYIWVYRTTKHLNADKSEEFRSPTRKLLMYIFIPFYSIYWVYMSCQRIDNLSKQRGLSSTISTLCVIFSIFMPFVSWIVMQSRINKICKIQPINIKSDNVISDFDKLREYKALLDDGVITQEDFEKKKNEII